MPSENDEFVIHSSTQHPTEIQHKIAEALNLPFAAITVQVRRMGGGFGGKESQANLPAIIAALAAYKTKRTVKLVYDRDEDMRVTGKRHDARIRYEVGFDDEGHLLALDIHQDLRCGMSYDLSVAIADRSMTHADNAYYLKDIPVIPLIYAKPIRHQIQLFAVLEALRVWQAWNALLTRWHSP